MYEHTGEHTNVGLRYLWSNGPEKKSRLTGSNYDKGRFLSDQCSIDGWSTTDISQGCRYPVPRRLDLIDCAA